MTPDEKILTADYLGKTIKVPWFAAATTGSFRGNIRKGQAIVRETEKIRIFLELSRRIEDPVLFDIGACFGTYSYITLFNLRLRAEAFEPYPKMIEYMKDIIRLNNIPNITVNEFGLSDRERKCDMQFGSAFQRAELNLNVGTTNIRTDTEGDFLFRSLDSLNIEKMDLVKIDVEGHEMEVLEGARETLRRCRPAYIQIEIHNTKKDRKERVSTILEKYLGNDYKVSHNFIKFHGDYFFRRKDF
ncbi:MAG: FkbM family methyltransferase [Bacteroidales bacterium]|jgi:FkbM family methyltransferase|nr:FkbM family methyltransferase [Bacteroidales bacterium]